MVKASLNLNLLDTGVFSDEPLFRCVRGICKGGRRRTSWFASPPIIVDPSRRSSCPATVWFRNTWSWGRGSPKPSLKRCGMTEAVIELSEPEYGKRWMVFEANPQLLFTENETNMKRLFNYDNGATYTKDGINDFVVDGEQHAVNPSQSGTKASAHYELDIRSGGSVTIKIRLTNTHTGPGVAGPEFDDVFAVRQSEADEFYSRLFRRHLSPDAKNVMRQSFAGLLWSKQFYHYIVSEWLEGDPAGPPPPEGHKQAATATGITSTMPTSSRCPTSGSTLGTPHGIWHFIALRSRSSMRISPKSS